LSFAVVQLLLVQDQRRVVQQATRRARILHPVFGNYAEKFPAENNKVLISYSLTILPQNV
jgi:hypothetical protein